MSSDPFNALSTLETSFGTFDWYRLAALEEAGLGKVTELPYVVRLILEAALRNVDGFKVTEDHVRLLAAWKTEDQGRAEIPYQVARVILQDFTGVPAVVDLAALRSAMERMGGDPSRINPQVPADLVIDHSIQVDHFGSADALAANAKREFERNAERYEFLRWGQQAFADFRVVPPGSGIVHQVNLEFLAEVIMTKDGVAFPDTLVGTDSHTTMINGLGVLGWGVGGIEAEAALLGQPIYMLLPKVVGVELTGTMPTGCTATDLVLTVVEILRRHGVVGKLVEFHGPGLSSLSLPDRATLANMAPEYGATTGFFPVDDETLAYLRQTGRSEQSIELIEKYLKAQGMFHTVDTKTPRYSEYVSIDMGAVVPSISGPKRPQDRIDLPNAKASFFKSCTEAYGASGGVAIEPNALVRADSFPGAHVALDLGGQSHSVTHGAIGFAAITSCTNTSNPSVLIAAGLLAQKATALGLRTKPWVKTSLAPGSKAVTRYLDAAGLMPSLRELGFHVVGYGCTTCIGNSGPALPQVVAAVEDQGLILTSVLSGNRNFEGRISPHARANYLASPPLVVAFAIAGTVDINMDIEPLGTDTEGNPVYLRDIWPSAEQVNTVMGACVKREFFEQEYSGIFESNPAWNEITSSSSAIYDWNPASTYVQEPPFFMDMDVEEPAVQPIRGARVLALLADSVTTDHISPAGAIPSDSPTATYLRSHNIERRDWNSYGSRRGNHQVMMRGTFGNIRLKNQLAPGTEGGWTTYLPTGEVTSIFDAAMKYQSDGTDLVVLAGSEYGTGSSRDWAAKGTFLLGVKVVIATSYERIHRSNLVFMGVLPLQFSPGESAPSLGLDGLESFDFAFGETLEPFEVVTVTATHPSGKVTTFGAIARVDSPVEVRYWRNGGILHTVLRDMVRQDRAQA
jgi:aconitate hydratase